MKTKSSNPNRFRRRIFSQLWMLALQFLLGMALNLIGSEARGNTHVLYVSILVLHVLNAIGLVEGGIYIALKSPSKINWWSAVVVALTLASGILTAMTGSNFWSFIMACGFIASAWLYVVIYVRADRAVAQR